MRRWMIGIGVLGLFLAAFGTVFALTYDGESYCREHPAWPNGTYLGQMHRQHIDHYVKLFGEDGACERWATDQQASAARGLRHAGYQVVRVEEPILYAQNCGDLSVIPVEWQITRRGNFWYNFVFNNTGGPDYRDLPYVLTLYDENLRELRTYSDYFAVSADGRYTYSTPYNPRGARLIHPSHAERVRCVKLRIRLDRIR